jgi:hypothetical protein
MELHMFVVTDDHFYADKIKKVIGDAAHVNWSAKYEDMTAGTLCRNNFPTTNQDFAILINFVPCDEKDCLKLGDILSVHVLPKRKTKKKG